MPGRAIGKSLPRLEDARLLTGGGCYSDDFTLPGQAYAWVVRSPYAHARIVAVDTSAARALPGVLSVLTGADAVADRLKPVPHIPAAMSPPDLKLPNIDGSACRRGGCLPGTARRSPTRSSTPGSAIRARHRRPAPARAMA